MDIFMFNEFYKKFLIALFLFMLLSTQPNNIYADNTQSQKNILIVNSYNQGFKWTDDQTAGIVRTIKKEPFDYAINIDYIDWNNYPYNNNIKYLYDYFKYKYTGKIFDVIITTDDAAFNFALDNQHKIFSDAPIVFSGVNQDGLSKIDRKYKNFTGVIENIDPTETIQMAININPSLKNVYVVFDNSESGKSTGKLVIDKIKEMNLNTIPLNNLTYSQLIDTVGELENNSIVFLTTYNSDANGNIVDFDVFSKDISRSSSVPVFNLYDFGLNNGSMGGSLISGELQGINAADLALLILKGEKVGSIPVITPITTQKIIDYKQIERFDIHPRRLPKDSIILNKPNSFFEIYKTIFLVGICALIVMTVFVFILLIYIKRISRMKKELYNRNLDLNQINEELLSSDEELKNQLDEVCAIQKSLSDSEEKNTYLAHHDALTGLPNRRSLFEDSSKTFSNSPDSKTAILFIDMDNFKYINDTMGHDFGDELIKNASKRLSLDLNENSILYRLGGDEFILLIGGIEKQSEAEKFTSNILHNFKKKFMIQNSALHISFSIGIAIYPDHGENMEELIKCADIAMYKAKEGGRNRYVVYDKNMNKAFTERMILEKHLYTAMGKEEFEIHYQPQLDLHTNRITGLEALLRWKSPELGWVPPLKFIKAAEDTHLIIQLGEWVLVQACGFIKQLHNSGHSDLIVSINISTLQLLQSDFVDRVGGILESFQLDPRCLELEITETVLIESFDAVCKKLQILREKGIGVALDDFGKGYSSLSYLKQLPIKTLKIDKCFIDSVSLIDENNSITRHIINMGKSMGMSVIAEGVERQDQLEYLKKYNCDKIQGFLFCKPLPKNEIESLITKCVEQKKIFL